MKIIYPNGSGGICVIHPTGELPIEQVAFKDVPNGVPYLYVEDAEIEALDRVEREAWTADFSNPDGHGGQE
jgi:hypothetical protein